MNRVIFVSLVYFAFALLLCSCTSHPVADGTDNVDLTSRRILHKYMPNYPQWAKEQGIEGEVKAQLTINPSGVVENVLVTTSCGYKELDDIVADSMKKWKFVPLPPSKELVSQKGIFYLCFKLK